MPNMLLISPLWTQNMHLIINMKMNHEEGEWKSVLQRESADLGTAFFFKFSIF
jgi:hypothetical protein